MPFFKMLTAPGMAWPPVPPAMTSLIWSAYRALDRTQWLPAREIEEMQLVQANELIRHCRSSVPYLRKALDGCGLPRSGVRSMEDFRRIPVTPREAYRDFPDELTARALPESVSVFEKPSFTSGTSGVPIRVLRTNRDELMWTALFMRDLEWAGMDPSKRIAGIRLLAMSREELPAMLEGVVSERWIPVSEVLFETGRAFGMDVRQSPSRQVEWLRAVRPDYLVSMPSNLVSLAASMEETGLTIPGIEAVQTIGEPLSPEDRAVIESAFGAPAKDLYSVTEGGYVASQCPTGSGLHVHSENVLLEVLREDGSPCGPGETGRAVLTALHALATPFLRYEILDDVTLAPGPCPCGRGLPLLSRVEGRRHTTLRLPGGGRKSSTGLILGIRQVGGVRQFQVVQRSEALVTVNVVPGPGWTAGHADRIRECVVFELGDVKVDMVGQSSIPRHRGGKHRLIVNEIDDGRAT